MSSDQSGSQPPHISVVIPVKNDATGIVRCLQGILTQTIRVMEIVVIDSGSHDGTQDAVRRFPKTRLLEIPASDFNHGATRNLGARECRGEFILFTVQDAWPVDNFWIEKLLQGFVAEDVSAVTGSQVVPQRPDTNPLEWFRPVSRPELAVHRFDSTEAYDAASPSRRAEASALEDVTCLYRRSLFERIRFRPVVYGEDLVFGHDALRAGLAVARNPAARVFHYHRLDYHTALKQTVTVALLRHELFGLLPDAPQATALRNAARLIRERAVPWRMKLLWWRYNNAISRGVADGIAKVRAAVAEGSDSLASLRSAYASTPAIPLGPTEVGHSREGGA